MVFWRGKSFIVSLLWWVGIVRVGVGCMVVEIGVKIDCWELGIVRRFLWLGVFLMGYKKRVVWVIFFLRFCLRFYNWLLFVEG